MTITISERIILLMQELGYNYNSFSVALGYSGSTKINRLKNKDNNPSIDIIIDIYNTFDKVNIEWIITGTGEMFKKTNDIDFEKKYNECIETRDKITNLLIEKEEEIKKLKKTNKTIHKL